jgi:hypothetical protein
MKSIILLLGLGGVLAIAAINFLGWSELRLACNADVFTNDASAEKISTEDVFLMVKYPSRLAFWKPMGQVTIEVRGIQFAGEVFRSTESEKLFFNKGSSSPFEGSLSLLSNASSIWDGRYFYKMKCKPR